MDKFQRKIRLVLLICVLASWPCVAQTPCRILEKRAQVEQFDYAGPGVSADGSVLFVQVRKSRDINIWNSKTGQIVNVLRPDGDSFALGTYIAVSADGRTIAAGLKNRKTVWVGDTFTGREIAEFSIDPFNVSMETRISPDGTVLLTGDYFKGAALWDVKKGRLIGMLSHPSLKDVLGNSYPFLDGIFSPDGNVVATAFRRGVYLWDAHSARFLKRLYSSEELRTKPFGYLSFIYDLEFSPDGSLLAAAGRDGQTELWEVDSGDLRATLEQGDRVFSVVFSPDGKFLATVSYDDRNIKVWDTTSGRLLYSVKGRRSDPFSITFSEPEIGLVAIPVKNAVEFRAAASGELVQKCDRMFGYFLPNGETFVSGSKAEGLGLFKVSF